MQLQEFFEHYRYRFHQYLQHFLTNRKKDSHELFKAIEYTLLGGGKRLRPLLAYATGHSFNANPDDLDQIAAALECIHIYSLIHDDLPALDNDDLRHGQASCHKKFGEAIAIICGDSMQSLAFELLSKPLASVDSKIQLDMIQRLSLAIGDLGMAGGQTLDILAEKKKTGRGESRRAC